MNPSLSKKRELKEELKNSIKNTMSSDLDEKYIKNKDKINEQLVEKVNLLNVSEPSDDDIFNIVTNDSYIIDIAAIIRVTLHSHAGEGVFDVSNYNIDKCKIDMSYNKTKKIFIVNTISYSLPQKK